MIAALIALLVVLMLGGSAGSWVGDIEKPLKHHVADENSRDAVLEAAEDLEDGMEEVGEALQAHFAQLLELHVDYSSDAVGFAAVSERLKADQAKAFALDLEARKTIKTALTAEEWQALFSENE